MRLAVCVFVLLAAPTAFAQEPPIPIPQPSPALARRAEAVRRRVHAAVDRCQIHDGDREMSWSHRSCRSTYRALGARTAVNAHGIGKAIVELASTETPSVSGPVLALISTGYEPLEWVFHNVEPICSSGHHTPPLGSQTAIIVPYLLHAIAIHIARPNADEQFVRDAFAAVSRLLGYDPAPGVPWAAYEEGADLRGAPARLRAFVAWHDAVAGETEAQRLRRAREQTLADLSGPSLPLRHAAVERLAIRGEERPRVRRSIEELARGTEASAEARRTFSSVAFTHCLMSYEETEALFTR